MAIEPAHLRRLACCDSEPLCVLCPLRPENAHLSLKELAAMGLKGNLDKVAAEGAAGDGTANDRTG